MNRSIIGTVSVVVLAALSGCSGGPVDDPEVKTTSQNLIAADLSVGGRFNLASCVLTESSVSKMVVFGGESAPGTEEDDGAIYNPTTNQWSAIGLGLSGSAAVMPAITKGKMIGRPGTDECYLFGGEDSSNDSLDTVYKYDRSADLASSGNDAWTLLATMPVPRTDFQLSLCGDTASKIIVVGGLDNTGMADVYVDDVDLYNISGDGWDANVATLQVGRSRFGLASNDDTFDQFVFAGGETGASAATDTVEVLEVTDNDCDDPGDFEIPSIATDGAPGSDIDINVRKDIAIFREGTSGKFVIAGGENAVGAVTTPSSANFELTITDFVAGSNSALASLTPSALTTERSRPIAVVSKEDAASPGEFFISLAGGADSTTPFSTAAVQAWRQSTATLGAQFLMSNRRDRAAAEYLPSADFAIIVGGIDDTPNPDVVLNTSETL